MREKYTLRYTGGMVPDVNQVLYMLKLIFVPFMRRGIEITFYGCYLIKFREHM